MRPARELPDASAAIDAQDDPLADAAHEPRPAFRIVRESFRDQPLARNAKGDARAGDTPRLECSETLGHVGESRIAAQHVEVFVLRVEENVHLQQAVHRRERLGGMAGEAVGAREIRKDARMIGIHRIHRLQRREQTGVILRFVLLQRAVIELVECRSRRGGHQQQCDEE